MRYNQGSRVSMRVARGCASLLSSHGRGTWPRDVLKVSRGLSRVEAGIPGFPRLVQVTSGGFSWWLWEARETGGGRGLSGLHWAWCIGRGPHLQLTYQVPMQYCSLQHQTLLPSPVTYTTGCCSCFGSIPSFFLELFLHSSPVTYWAPTDLGSSSFSVISFSFSYCSWGSRGKKTVMVCHSLLQLTMFCQNSSPWPICFRWPYMAIYFLRQK